MFDPIEKKDADVYTLECPCCCTAGVWCCWALLVVGSRDVAVIEMSSGLLLFIRLPWR
jgi:hypothetical protein